MAFTGGFGISEQWAGNGRQPGRWRIVLGGPPSLPVLEPVGAVTTEIVSSSPLGGSFEAYTLFLLAIEAARRSIEATNPYFVPDARMSATILAAVRRGVRVRVLVPAVIDHPWVREASRREFGPMLPAGNRSFALNEEVNATFYDAAIARRPEQAFEEDPRYARAVTSEDWRNRGSLTRVRELLALTIRSQM